MNLIDFIRESAKFMAEDLPDVYTFESAVEDLTNGIEALRTCPNNDITNTLLFSSYTLIRVVDQPGVEEFILSRRLTSAILFADEDEPLVYTWHKDIDLPMVIDED